MAFAPEDRGPAWLADWGRETGHTDYDGFTGYVDPTALAVDIGSLVAFADSLKAEHELDFRPHAHTVCDGMSAAPGQPPGSFVELTDVMMYHREMLVLATTAIAAHDRAVLTFVEAAKTISESYRGADAMSAATVNDVERNLATPPPATTSTGTDQQPVVTPEQAAQQVDTPVTATDPAATGTAPDNGTEYPAS